ncbi:MAG: HDOD domain-containing protein [Mariprofundales bacterium]|nr:HDOD domain-containing protein [Mariprofundales bacterium]
MENIFVGRQPVFDSNLKVVAYELLARLPKERQKTSNLSETAQVLVHTLMDIGLDNLVGEYRAYMDATSSFMMDDILNKLPPEKVSFTLLQDTPITEELIDGIRELKGKGYTIIIDDFIYSPQLEVAMELADVVKIYYPAVRHCLAEEVAQLRRFKVKLLISGIDSHDAMEACKPLNFDLYQGDFFCQPDTIDGKTLTDNKMAILRALQQVISAQAVDEIEDVVKQDVALSYRLLKYINSAAFGMNREIISIKQALTLLGLDNIRRWLSLLSLAAIGEHKPPELIKISLVRGKMLELTASMMGYDNQSDYFILGMFSVLDALLDQPMKRALEGIALPQEVHDGLMKPDSSMGVLLTIVRFIEHNSWQQAEAACLVIPNLNAHLLMQQYLQAIRWADEQMRSLGI